LLKFKLGHYPSSVASLIHSTAAHGSGGQAGNAVADADRHAAVFGGRMSPTMYKACAGVAPPPRHAAGVLSRAALYLSNFSWNAANAALSTAISILLETAMSVRTRPQFQLILGARDVVRIVKDRTNYPLRLLIDIIHKFPIWPARIIREKKEFDIVTKPPQLLQSTFDELAA
jgi:hypothetical protein